MQILENNINSFKIVNELEVDGDSIQFIFSKKTFFLKLTEETIDGIETNHFIDIIKNDEKSFFFRFEFLENEIDAKMIELSNIIF